MKPLIALLALVPALASAAPQFVSQSGRLLDTTGTPVSGPQSLTFRLVNEAGTERYSQITSVAVEDGYYSVQLGSLPDSIFAENLDVVIELGVQELGRQTLTAVPYALSVDGDVRVSSAPASCAGRPGQLRYVDGRIEVCDGSAYNAIAPTAGVVGFQYDQTSTPGALNGAIPWDDTVPQISEGSKVLEVTHTAQSTDNVLVLEATVVWSEFTNNSDQFTVAIFRNGGSSALGATAASSSNGNSGCGGGSGYHYACTAPIRLVIPVPSTSSETYQVRIGTNGPKVYFNQGITGQDQGNSLTSTFTLTEIAVP